MAIVMDGGGRMEEVYLEEEEEEELADEALAADYGAPAPPVRAPRLPCLRAHRAPRHPTGSPG